MKVKLLLALVLVSFVQVQQAAEEVKEERQVAVHPTHTAHNALHGMIDTPGFTPDLIKIVDEYVGLFYERIDQQVDQEHECAGVCRFGCNINLCNGDSGRFSKGGSRFIAGPGGNGFGVCWYKQYSKNTTPNIVVNRRNKRPIAWISDDTFVFGEDNIIKLVEADTGRIKKEIQTPDSVSVLSVLSPVLIASASNDKSEVFIHCLDNGDLCDNLDPKNESSVKKLRRLKNGSLSVIYDDGEVVTYSNRELLTQLLTPESRKKLRRQKKALDRKSRARIRTIQTGLLAGWGVGAAAVIAKTFFGGQ